MLERNFKQTCLKGKTESHRDNSALWLARFTETLHKERQEIDAYFESINRNIQQSLIEFPENDLFKEGE